MSPHFDDPKAGYWKPKGDYWYVAWEGKTPAEQPYGSERGWTVDISGWAQEEIEKLKAIYGDKSIFSKPKEDPVGIMTRYDDYEEKPVIGGNTCHLCGSKLEHKSVVTNYAVEEGFPPDNEHTMTYACGTTIVRCDNDPKNDVLVGPDCIRI